MPTTTDRRHASHHPPPPYPKPKSNLLSLVLKLVIMSLILSLFLLFIGIAAVALIHIILAGSLLHRRPRRRRRPDFPAYSLEDLRRHLPARKYPGEAERLRECSICLECFKEGEWCRELPACGHAFHACCVDKWLTKVPNCPVCRSEVRLNRVQSDSTIWNEESKLFWAIGL